MIGKKIHNLAKKLWPINRSITGEGNRQTLKILRNICTDLKIKEVEKIKEKAKIKVILIPFSKTKLRLNE